MFEGQNINDQKAEYIIGIAQKKFGLYGYEKTTMREVAEEIGKSKGLLYYYFPDKESLYKAVLEREQAEFIKNLSAEIEGLNDPADCLRKYVSIRLSYFRTLVNIGRLRIKAYIELKPVIAESMKAFSEEENSVVRGIFEKGTDKGIFIIENIPETAALFLDLLRGLRIAVIKEKEIMTIDDSEYSVLSEKAMAFTEMFIKSLMYR
jgi:TetR/AcrR family transcriptional regulator